MMQTTVNGKTAVDRVLHWMDINPSYKIDNAARTIEMIFDFPAIALMKPLNKESMEIIVSKLEVDYETALNKVMWWIKTHLEFKVDDGVETLAVVFDVPGKVPRKDIELRMKSSE